MPDQEQPKPGYTQGQPGTCRGCGAAIYWWMTPAGKRSPHDQDGTSHFATCPEAPQFRGRKEGPTR